MTIEIRLIGFGDHRPARFNGKNRLHIEIETPTSVRALLQLVGIEEAPDVIAMDSSTVIPPARWDETRISDHSTLTLLSAIEGG
jgi:thiamine biosynthesis protein ThiS